MYRFRYRLIFASNQIGPGIVKQLPDEKSNHTLMGWLKAFKFVLYKE